MAEDSEINEEVGKDDRFTGMAEESEITEKVGKDDRRLRKEAKRYREGLDKRGVIYLSRVPPFMKPNKARIMFEQYGEVTRLYLSEEDSSVRAKRKQNGGNGSKQFNEGWIEFSEKKIAKSVAESLNNTCIGGKKGNFYHDDIWNIKYLKNFKWDYLTEKFAYERKIQDNKLKLAMSHAKRENAEIVEAIEKTKVLEVYFFNLSSVLNLSFSLYYKKFLFFFLKAFL